MEPLEEAIKALRAELEREQEWTMSTAMALHEADEREKVLTAERDRYKAALGKYGTHYGYCAQNRWPGKGKTFGECDCGFAKFLSPTPPKEP